MDFPGSPPPLDSDEDDLDFGDFTSVHPTHIVIERDVIEGAARIRLDEFNDLSCDISDPDLPPSIPDTPDGVNSFEDDGFAIWNNPSSSVIEFDNPLHNSDQQTSDEFTKWKVTEDVPIPLAPEIDETFQPEKGCEIKADGISNFSDFDSNSSCDISSGSIDKSQLTLGEEPAPSSNPNSSNVIHPVEDITATNTETSEHCDTLSRNADTEFIDRCHLSEESKDFNCYSFEVMPAPNDDESSPEAIIEFSEDEFNKVVALEMDTFTEFPLAKESEVLKSEQVIIDSTDTSSLMNNTEPGANSNSEPDLTPEEAPVFDDFDTVPCLTAKGHSDGLESDEIRVEESVESGDGTVVLDAFASFSDNNLKSEATKLDLFKDAIDEECDEFDDEFDNFAIFSTAETAANDAQKDTFSDGDTKLSQETNDFDDTARVCDAEISTSSVAENEELPVTGSDFNDFANFSTLETLKDLHDDKSSTDPDKCGTPAEDSQFAEFSPFEDDKVDTQTTEPEGEFGVFSDPSAPLPVDRASPIEETVNFDDDFDDEEFANFATPRTTSETAPEIDFSADDDFDDFAAPEEEDDDNFDDFSDFNTTENKAVEASPVSVSLSHENSTQNVSTIVATCFDNGEPCNSDILTEHLNNGVKLMRDVDGSDHQFAVATKWKNARSFSKLIETLCLSSSNSKSVLPSKPCIVEDQFDVFGVVEATASSTKILLPDDLVGVSEISATPKLGPQHADIMSAYVKNEKQKLSPEAQLIVDSLPDLSFMLSPVLMFPVKG